MKGLSLLNPWAQLVALSEKRIETRSWRPLPRELGKTIAIHAGKGWTADAYELCQEDPYKSVLARHGFQAFTKVGGVGVPRHVGMPFGAIVAVADLIGAQPTSDIEPTLSEQELAFGNYSEGRWAWVLDNIRAVVPAIQCKGALSLWHVPHDIEQRIWITLDLQTEKKEEPLP